MATGAEDWLNIPDEIDEAPWTREAREEEEYDSRIQENLKLATPLNPETEQKTQRVVKDLDIPQSMGRDNARKLGNWADQRDAEKAVRDTIVLKRKVAEDFNFTARNSDDLEALGSLETHLHMYMRAFKTMADIHEVAPTSFAQGTFNASGSLYLLPSAIGRAMDMPASYVKKATGADVNTTFWRDVLGGTEDFGPNAAAESQFRAVQQLGETDAGKIIAEKNRFANEAFDKAIDGDPEDLGKVLTDPVAAVAFIGNAAPSFMLAWASGGSLSFIMTLEAMEVSKDAADFERRTGVDIDPILFTQAAAQVALINGWLERLSLHKVLKGAKGKISSFFKGFFTESTHEGAQNANTNAAIWLSYNRQGEFSLDNPALTKGTVPSMMGGGGVGGGISILQAMGQASGPDSDFARDMVRAESALQMYVALDAVIEASKGTKLYERNPEEQQEYVGEILKAAGVINVIIEPEDITVLFESTNARETLPPRLVQLLDESIADGQDVTIPAADYIVALAEFHDDLKENIRYTAGGYNATEARESIDGAEERVLDKADELMQAPQADKRKLAERRVDDLFDAAAAEDRRKGPRRETVVAADMSDDERQEKILKELMANDAADTLEQEETITNRVEVQKLIDGADNFTVTENGEGKDYISTVSAGGGTGSIHEGTTVTLNKEENLAIRKLKAKLKNNIITRLEFREQTHDIYRGAFKRVMANDAIEEAQRDPIINEHKPIFTTREDPDKPGQFHMSEAKWLKYQRDVIGSIDETEYQLQLAALKETKKIRAVTKKRKKAIQEEVTQEVMSENVYVAMAATKGDDAKLGVVADLLGYQSVEQLEDAIAAAEPVEDRIKRITQERMQKQYGDLGTPEAREAALEEAIQNETHAKVAHTELESLSNQTGKPNTTYQVAKAAAAETIDNSHLTDIHPHQYHVDEIGHATKSGEANAKKDQDRAHKWKFAQVMDGHLFRSATKAKLEIAKMLRAMKLSKSQRKKMRGEALAYRDKLLERFDLRTSSTQLKTDHALAVWVEAETARLVAQEIEIPPNLVDENYRQHYETMTLAEFRELHDLVKRLDGLARREEQMYQENKKMSYEEEVVQDLKELQAIHPDAFNEDGTPKKYKKDTKPLLGEKVDAFKDTAYSSLINLENIVDILVLREGVEIYSSLVGRLDDAGTETSTLMKEISDFLAPAVKAFTLSDKIMAKFASDWQLVESTGEYFSREKRMVVAFNYGNPEGRQRLIDGNGWDHAQIWEIVSTLTQKDVDFINALWAVQNEIIWPKLAALDARTKGLPAKKVDSLPFTINGMELTGGYVPIVYDGDLNSKTYDMERDDAVTAMRGGTVRKAETPQSASKERIEVIEDKPLNLTMRGIIYKINETVHDITHREAVMDTYRVMKSKRMADAIRTIAGPKVYDAMLERVREIAAPAPTPKDWVDRRLEWARKNTLINMMGMSFNTFAINVLGVWPMVKRVGGGRYAKALHKMTGRDAKKWYDWVLKDPYMRERVRLWDRDLATSSSRFTGEQTITPDLATMLIPISAMDRMVTIPGYIAAYEKGLESFDNNPARAREFASRVVRQTQGSGRKVDNAAVQDRTKWNKLITMFMSFFIAQLASMETERAISSRQWSEKKRLQAAINLTSAVVLVIVIPATLEAIARRECDARDTAMLGQVDDLGELAYCSARASAIFTSSFFPLIRAMVPAIWKNFDPETKSFEVRLSAIESSWDTVSDMPDAGVNLLTGQGMLRDVKTLIRGGGFLVGGPGYQASRTLDGWDALQRGETDNPLVLLTGAN